METRDGSNITLREHFDSYFVDSEGNNQQLIHRTERATDDRVFLIHKNIHSKHVRAVIVGLDIKLDEIFTP